MRPKGVPEHGSGAVVLAGVHLGAAAAGAGVGRSIDGVGFRRLTRGHSFAAASRPRHEPPGGRGAWAWGRRR